MALAADKVGHLLECAVKQRVYAQYMRALVNAKERNEPDNEMFDRLAHSCCRELASLAAAASSQSSSWQTNAESQTRLAALGEIAGFFLDVARIGPR